MRRKKSQKKIVGGNGGCKLFSENMGRGWREKQSNSSLGTNGKAGEGRTGRAKRKRKLRLEINWLQAKSG